MPATRTISTSPSPSRRQASRSASSRSFTYGKNLSRVPHGNAFEERAEVRQPQARRDVVNARVARGWFEQHDVAKLGQRRTGASGPYDAMKALAGAAHRQPVTNRAEPEIQRGEIGHPRHEQEQWSKEDKRQDEEHAVDDHPPAVAVVIVLQCAADERED